uniref:Pheromone binding protein 1 n=1 Tax=Cyrtotrachelus buqueti TaxID=1892066 RepID=A0A1B3IIF7_9CUCU|nr:pheromone binding protein 1 [Cyrtotrachelus buqueti]
MKLLLVLALALVAVNGLSESLVDEMKEKLQKYGLECAEKEKASEEDIQALMNHERPVTHAGKCTIFCTFKKFDLMKEDGSFGPGDMDWIERAKADDAEFMEKLTGIQSTCEKTVQIDSDPCETALRAAKCAKDEGEKLGITSF